MHVVIERRPAHVRLIPNSVSPPRQLESALRHLAADDEHTCACWEVLYRFLCASYEQVADQIKRHVPEGQVIHLAWLFLILAVHPGFASFERKIRFFEVAQALGVHLLPVHFYNPVPDTSKMRDAIWDERFDAIPGRNLNVPKQLDLLESLGRWNSELLDIPQEQTTSGEYYWHNPAFCAGDAATYYAMIREFRPARLLEIGCGYSTLMAARACLCNGSTRMHCIEPYLPAFLRPLLAGVTSLTNSPIQDVPLDRFEQLEPTTFSSSTRVMFVRSDQTSTISS